jgi:hypothetical protein
MWDGVSGVALILQDVGKGMAGSCAVSASGQRRLFFISYSIVLRLFFEKNRRTIEYQSNINRITIEYQMAHLPA